MIKINMAWAPYAKMFKVAKAREAYTRGRDKAVAYLLGEKDGIIKEAIRLKDLRHGCMDTPGVSPDVVAEASFKLINKGLTPTGFGIARWQRKGSYGSGDSFNKNVRHWGQTFTGAKAIMIIADGSKFAWEAHPYRKRPRELVVACPRGEKNANIDVKQSTI